jgi:hypothetical protein
MREFSGGGVQARAAGGDFTKGFASVPIAGRKTIALCIAPERVTREAGILRAGRVHAVVADEHTTIAGNLYAPARYTLLVQLDLQYRSSTSAVGLSVVTLDGARASPVHTECDVTTFAPIGVLDDFTE